MGDIRDSKVDQGGLSHGQRRQGVDAGLLLDGEAEGHGVFEGPAGQLPLKERRRPVQAPRPILFAEDHRQGYDLILREHRVIVVVIGLLVVQLHLGVREEVGAGRVVDLEGDGPLHLRGRGVIRDGIVVVDLLARGRRPARVLQVAADAGLARGGHAAVVVELDVGRMADLPELEDTVYIDPRALGEHAGLHVDVVATLEELTAHLDIEIARGSVATIIQRVRGAGARGAIIAPGTRPLVVIHVPVAGIPLGILAIWHLLGPLQRVTTLSAVTSRARRAVGALTAARRAGEEFRWVQELLDGHQHIRILLGQLQRDVATRARSTSVGTRTGVAAGSAGSAVLARITTLRVIALGAPFALGAIATIAPPTALAPRCPDSERGECGCVDGLGRRGGHLEWDGPGMPVLAVEV